MRQWESTLHTNTEKTTHKLELLLFNNSFHFYMYNIQCKIIRKNFATNPEI